MAVEDAKVYNVCLMRLRHQIENARKKLQSEGRAVHAMVLESYNTGETEEIIDILEIYDIEDRTPEGLREKLEDLAATVSLLLRERVAFGYDHQGNLGIYFVPDDAAAAKTGLPREDALASRG